MTEHPITPPPALVQQWVDMPLPTKKLLVIASQWGADQELEACCEWVNDDLAYDVADRLRAARRPKPPSLKEQALEQLRLLQQCGAGHRDTDKILRVLEALDD